MTALDDDDDDDSESEEVDSAIEIDLAKISQWEKS
jgi:hypothetical protein